jgi:hypothetical protein
VLYSLRLYLRQISRYRQQGAGADDLRFYKQWINSQGGSSMESRLPWLSFRAIELLESRIKPEHHVFEFGGGGSTLFFLDRVASVVTAEHDTVWFDKLKSSIDPTLGKRWTALANPPEAGDLVKHPDPSLPEHYHSSDSNYRGMNFRNYASSIDAFPAERFDWILVDGRARPSCLLHAVSKLKRGGYLILDNFERATYHPAAREISKMSFRLVLDRQGPCPFTPDFTRTAIWQKVDV